MKGCITVQEFMKQEDWGFGCNAGVDLKVLVAALTKCGVSKIEVDVSYHLDPTYSDTLYVKLGKRMPTAALCAIARQKPDECSVDAKGWVRLWWD